MKKFSLFSLFALMLAVAASAFSEKDPVSQKELVPKKTLETFVYIGTTEEDQDDASQYVPLSSNPSVTCGGTQTVICRILAEPDESGMHPDFSEGNPVDNPDQFQVISKRALQ